MLFICLNYLEMYILRFEIPDFFSKMLGMVEENKMDREYFPFYFQETHIFSAENEEIKKEWCEENIRKDYPLVAMFRSQYRIKSDLPSTNKWCYTSITYWYYVAPYWE